MRDENPLRAPVRPSPRRVPKFSGDEVPNPSRRIESNRIVRGSSVVPSSADPVAPPTPPSPHQSLFLGVIPDDATGWSFPAASLVVRNPSRDAVMLWRARASRPDEVFVTPNRGALPPGECAVLSVRATPDLAALRANDGISPDDPTGARAYEVPSNELEIAGLACAPHGAASPPRAVQDARWREAEEEASASSSASSSSASERSKERPNAILTSRVVLRLSASAMGACSDAADAVRLREEAHAAELRAERARLEFDVASSRADAERSRSALELSRSELARLRSTDLARLEREVETLRAELDSALGEAERAGEAETHEAAAASASAAAGAAARALAEIEAGVEAAKARALEEARLEAEERHGGEAERRLRLFDAVAERLRAKHADAEARARDAEARAENAERASDERALESRRLDERRVREAHDAEARFAERLAAERWQTRLEEKERREKAEARVEAALASERAARAEAIRKDATRLADVAAARGRHRRDARGVRGTHRARGGGGGEVARGRRGGARRGEGGEGRGGRGDAARQGRGGASRERPSRGPRRLRRAADARDPKREARRGERADVTGTPPGTGGTRNNPDNTRTRTRTVPGRVDGVAATTRRRCGVAVAVAVAARASEGPSDFDDLRRELDGLRPNTPARRRTSELGDPEVVRARLVLLGRRRERATAAATPLARVVPGFVGDSRPAAVAAAASASPAAAWTRSSRGRLRRRARLRCRRAGGSARRWVRARGEGGGGGDGRAGRERGARRGERGGRRRCSGAPVSRRGDSTSLPDPARDERGERGERGEKRGEGRRARLMETTQPAGGRPSLMMRFFLGETFSSGSDAFGRPTESERAASKRVTKGKKGKHEISGQPRASTGGGRSGPRARRAASRAGTGRRSGRAVARVSGARSRRPA